VLWNLSFKTLNTIPSFKWCLRGSWIYSFYHLGEWNSPNVWIQHLYSYKKCFSAAVGNINQYKAYTSEASVQIPFDLTAQLRLSKVICNNEQCHSMLQDTKASSRYPSNENSLGSENVCHFHLNFYMHLKGKRRII
jgi:hypothetical protein